jgi:hypothetical protein
MREQDAPTATDLQRMKIMLLHGTEAQKQEVLSWLTNSNRVREQDARTYECPQCGEAKEICEARMLCTYRWPNETELSTLRAELAASQQEVERLTAKASEWQMLTTDQLSASRFAGMALKKCAEGVYEWRNIRAEAAESRERKLRVALQPLISIEPEAMYIEARVGSDNHRGECVRLIVDRRFLQAGEKALEKSCYENHDAAKWLRELIAKVKAALHTEEPEPLHEVPTGSNKNKNELAKEATQQPTKEEKND